MDPLTIVGLGFMLANFAYHRLKTEVPEVRDLVHVQIPKFEDGTVPPIFYGRVFIQPGACWWGNMQSYEPNPFFDYLQYRGSVLHMIGIPFYLGDTRLRGVYAGQNRMEIGPFGGPSFTSLLPNLGLSDGDGSNTANHVQSAPVGMQDATYIEFKNEFADGNPSQNFLAGAGSHTAAAWAASGIAEEDMPGHRGYATLLCRMELGAPNIPIVGVEVSTYPPAVVSNPKIGEECNPVHAMIDLISGVHGGSGQLAKLGVPISRLDTTYTWQACADALRLEGHGYSRVIGQKRSVDDVLMEILRQVDGVMWEDHADGLFKLKLIRPDFALTGPNAIKRIDINNCEGLLNFSAAGWTSVVNKIRVVFTDRANNYTNGSASAHNQANAVGQDGEVNELVLQFPGVCTQELADEIAGRELDARSRPLAKFTAIVDRSFVETHPGEAIEVSWGDANIGSMIFRVGRASQSTADTNLVRLDLIEDHFWVHRRIVDVSGQTAPFPGSGGFLAG